MTRRILSVVLVLTLLALGPVAVTHAGERAYLRARTMPSYLVLRTPARSEKHHSYTPARGYGVTTSPYAYGWFGARPKRHWSRGTGYFGDYLQWSVR